MTIRICLFGPSGSGKTTIANYLSKAYGAEIIKISKPLYDVQHSLYKMIGKEIEGQDGELLQFLGQKIEKESPNWLANHFIDTVNRHSASILVNDDCRIASYPVLKANSFIFIKISTSRDTIKARQRNDHISPNPNHSTEMGFENFQADFVINNDNSLEKAFEQTNMIMDSLLNQGYGWLTGKKIWDEVLSGRLIIDPFDPKLLNPNSYNYRLSPTLKHLTCEVIDCKKPDEYEVINIPEEGYELQPGECYLGTTEEVFGSKVYASLITGRSSVGRKFLTNHVTAGLIDQGFVGNITLEITAQKPTRVYPKMPFGQIFWFTTFGPPYLYNGKYQNQREPTLSKLCKDFF